ncbi:porin, partial [Brucella intermedia]|uniref:porin n=1 Tax=Brucella intermedia TaxID=94625 RepID=UPI00132261D1
YVRYDAAAGRDAYDGSDAKTWRKNTRFTLRTSTASETELGTLKTFTELRYNWTGGGDGEETTEVTGNENSSLR